MKIAILHDNLNLCGGAEKLALVTMNALRDSHITLVTSTKPDIDRIKMLTNEDVKIDDIIYTPLSFIPKTYRSIAVVLKKLDDRFDLVFNTNGDTIPFIHDDITYIHYPLPLKLYANNNAWEYNGILWDIYYAPVRIMHRLLAKRTNDNIILTNSNFTRGKIREVLGRDSIVVYPPVDTSIYKQALMYKYELADNTDQILVISRFTPDKNLILIPELAKRLKARFVIIGTKGYGADNIIMTIKRRAEELGVSDKIILIPNATNEIKFRELCRSKVYLHLKRYEHFGISIVEALAAGCSAVTYNAGGPKEFVPDEYRYNSIEEVVDKLDYALAKWDIKEAERSASIASRFDRTIYENKIKEIVRTINIKNV
ncbi:MAG: glycosyl transferase family 1 [Candidatus Nitrosocaldaceae archaeon]|nr:MAG: glycosyl transferase family 1 [Candidatus Nitrosocaldaceae archaeon]